MNSQEKPKKRQRLRVADIHEPRYSLISSASSHVSSFVFVILVYQNKKYRMNYLPL